LTNAHTHTALDADELPTLPVRKCHAAESSPTSLEVAADERSRGLVEHAWQNDSLEMAPCRLRTVGLLDDVGGFGLPRVLVDDVWPTRAAGRGMW
jgi:hypothetical protein